MFIGLVFCTHEGLSQIMASASQGCAPLTEVVFSHGYENATNINWNFDDGASSNLANPTHTFSNPGNYTVEFTATVNGVTENAQILIQVFGLPEADFNIVGITNGCVGLDVFFNDDSQGGSGSEIAQWQWAFGDGGSNASSSNPSYSYNVSGIFDVSLIVTDENGCQGSISYADTIKISALPNIQISTVPGLTVVCSAPFTVTFSSEVTSGSPLGDELTYDWSFGNAVDADVQNPPSVIYEDVGNYTASLTVTDDNDCSNTAYRNVFILNPVASFYAIGGGNDTVCRQVEFVNESIGNSFNFDYGDGLTGNELFHTYNAPGTYDVTLTVNSNQCSDDTTIQIVVQFPVVSISMTPDTLCQFPGLVSFSAGANAQIASYAWSFPEDETSNQSNPVESIQYPILEYTINYAREIEIELSIITADGCPGYTVDTLIIVRPNALFYPSEDEGCAPLSVSFINYSSTDVSYIDEMIWNFGDGSPQVTTADVNNVSHLYNSPGIYHPFLTVITASGCRDTSWMQTIEVGSPPNPSFVISPDRVCIGDEIQITDTSAPSDSIDTWHYGGDVGMLFSCQTDQNPIVTFNASTGTSEITMSAGFRGCFSTTTQTITVDGPLAKLTHTCNCDAPMIYPFEVEVSDADHWTWDFGDGTIIENSTNLQQSHTFAQTGDYTVTVTAYNNTSGCDPFPDTELIKVRNIESVISLADSACVGVPVLFTGTNSSNVAFDENPGYNSYVWYFGDQTRPKVCGGTYYHEYQQPGVFEVELWVEDINGCLDSSSTTIYISGVDVDIELIVDSPCLPMSVLFDANATSDLSVVSYEWDFGDGAISSDIGPNHTFTEELMDGEYVVPYVISVQATNSLGCSEQDEVEIMPNVPNANYTISGENQFCVGGSTTLTPNISSAGNQVLWNFGDGFESSSYTETHQYNTTGLYDVSLTVTNAQGCSNTVTYDDFIFVQDYPQAAFLSTLADGGSTITDGEYVCYPLAVSFTDISVVNPFGIREWNLGNGDPVIPESTVGSNYNQPGDYTIELIVASTAGCADTASSTIHVVGPIGDFTLNPLSICRGDEINLQLIDTADVMTWQWDFGDGVVAAEQDQITYDYEFEFNPESSETVVSLILWNQDSICSIVKSQTLDFVDVYADFGRNSEASAIDTAHCVGVVDNFTNLSSTGIDSWFWDFGNGQTFTTANPPQIQYEPGNYVVTLAVLAQPEGCVDTVRKAMVIFPLPQAQAYGGAICLGDNFELNASGGVTYVWEPEALLSDHLIQNPIAFPDITTEFTVLVTDTNGCANDTVTFVTVYQPPVEVDQQQTLIIGETVELELPYGDGYTYEWTPDVWLSCIDCGNPVFQPLEDTVYYVTIEDTLGCFSVVSRYEFDVLLLASVDVPDAFSPNGDSVNEMLFVEGWGIEKVLEFKIFNRWGEMVFETTNPNIGWDGTYKGQDQMADTYTYIVSVKPYIQEIPLTKQGFINLIR